MLAKTSGAEPALIVEIGPWSRQTWLRTSLPARTMKYLAVMSAVREERVDRYSSTALSDALTLPEYRDGIIYTY